jgi:uncharacterized membrane protein
MTTADVGAGRVGARPATGHSKVRRISTETKASFKTTELIAYVAAVAGVIIMSALVGTNSGHADYFRADKAMLYIAILTVGYMVSRGIAKAGSRDYYDDDRD